jgi:hypothetical protein
VTTPFVRPASVKADAHHDFVLIFGDERPLELLDWLRRVPGNYEDLDIRTAPAGDLQGFIDLAIDGSVLFRIGSAPGVLIVAGTGTASSQLLRTVLATEGKTKEHSVLAKFLGKAELAKPRVLTYVAHTLSMLRMQQDMNASIGVPADPMLDAYFDAIAPLYDGEAGLTAGTVSVVSDGVRIRSYSTRAR